MGSSNEKCKCKRFCQVEPAEAPLLLNSLAGPEYNSFVILGSETTPESDSGCISLRFIYQNDITIVMLSVAKHP
jgi:hypothetical protein